MSDLRRPQDWAITGTIGGLADLRHADGFYCFCDNANLDAPLCLPSGATIENIYLGERTVIGGLTVRQGAFE